MPASACVGRVDHHVDAVAQHVEVGIGHQRRDLDQRVAPEVKPGHLTIDPHQKISHTDSLSGRFRYTYGALVSRRSRRVSDISDLYSIADLSGAYVARPPHALDRRLATSAKVTAAATDALSDSITEVIGIATRRSQVSPTSRDRPRPSEPTTTTSGPIAASRS